MREYLDPVVKADQCAQYVDDNGIEANNATDLAPEQSGSLQVLWPSNIEADNWEMTLRSQTSWNPRKDNLTRKDLTTSSENSKFSKKSWIPQVKKALQWYLGFVNYYRNYIARMAEKLNPFYKLPNTEVPINITSELNETFDSVNKALSDACQLALKQPFPGKQLVLMTDASFRIAGYGLMIEKNPDQKIQSKRRTYAPVAFGSKISFPAQLKMSICPKEFLAIFMVLLEFSHILWEATKPTIVLTDNKSVTRFFPNKGNSGSTLERMWLCVAI